MGRFNHFKLDEIAIWDTVQFFQPSKYIRDAVERYIIQQFDTKQAYRVAVHRRAMKEGGHDTVTGSPYVCRYYHKSASKSGRYGFLRGQITQAIQDHWESRYKATVNVEPYMDMVEKEEEDKKNEEKKTEVMKSLAAMKAQAITDMYDRTCAMNMSDIFEILQFHKQSPLRGSESSAYHSSLAAFKKEGENNKDKDSEVEKFFLATDGQEPEILKDWIQNHGAITSNDNLVVEARHHRQRPKWSRAQELADIYNEKGKRCMESFNQYLQEIADDKAANKNHESIWHKGRKTEDRFTKFAHWISNLDAYKTELAVFDMWMLRQSHFFIGSWHSTLTRTVCHWRGFEHMKRGSNCYLGYKWTKTRKQQDDYTDWFDLNAVYKPMLTWEQRPPPQKD